MKAISYSLFGYGKARNPSCFDFSSYLRGLMLCLRFNRLIYPEWQTILETDQTTYNANKNIFEPLEKSGVLIIEINRDNAALCEAMLWRLRPIYRTDVTHLLCRDLDSPSVYREAQAVQHWMSHHTKAIHAITDSVSHDIALLGGMIGMNCGDFRHRTSTYLFKDLMDLCLIDLSVKGSDQTFLNQTIYPFFGHKGSDSITQHYFKGHGNTFLSDYHTCICWREAVAVGHKRECHLNVELSIPQELEDSNDCVQHIGSAGYNETATMRWINKHKNEFKDLIEIEKQYPNIFYWNHEA